MENFTLKHNDGFKYTINYVEFEYKFYNDEMRSIGSDIQAHADDTIKKYPGIQAINMCKTLVEFSIKNGGNKKNINITITKS